MSKIISFNSKRNTDSNCLLHRGSYDEIGEAYAFIMKYAEKNGYKVNGLSRECYIGGIWNKDSVD